MPCEQLEALCDFVLAMLMLLAVGGHNMFLCVQGLELQSAVRCGSKGRLSTSHQAQLV